MKRTTKIISFILLLAVVLSVFGIMASFAETDNGIKPVVVYDMDKKTDLKDGAFSNDAKAADGRYSPTISKQSDATGGYYLIENNVATGGKIGTGGAYFNITSSEPIVIKSGSSKGDKDTDFVVIDMDVAATDAAMLDGIHLHTRYQSTTGANAQDTLGYPVLKGMDPDGFYVDLSKSTKAEYDNLPLTDITNEWINVTLVYDYRGETYSEWKCYVYINGNLTGTLSAGHKDSAYFSWIRFSLPSTATADFAATKIRNFTLTKFPIGYEGDLTNSNNLGKYAVNLDTFEDMSYCFEGINPKRNEKIATIERAGEIIEIYDFSELDAGFVDGDVVTLHKNIYTPLIVNASVTFKDNGFTHKEVDLTGVDLSTAAYVVIDSITRAVKSSGTADNFNNVVPTQLGTCVLLSDVTYTSSSTMAMAASKLGIYYIYDLNGHKITYSCTTRAYNFNDNDNGRLRFIDGTFEFTYISGDFTMMTKNNSIIFENLDKMKLTGTFIDHRRGIVSFINCDDIECSSLITAKSSGGIATAVLLDSCNLNMTGTTAPFSVANTSSSSKRQGSAVASFIIKDSEINFTSGGKAPMFEFIAYGNATGTATFDADGNVTDWAASAAYHANKNVADLNIINSKLTTDHYLISTNIYEIRAMGNYDGVSGNEYLFVNENFTFDVNVNIEDSMIDAAYLVYQKATASGYDVTLHPEQANYRYDVNVNVDSGDFYLDNPYMLYSETAKFGAAFDLAFTGECAVPSTDYFAGTRTDGNTVYVDPTYTVVPRSNPDYPAYAITRNLASYPYIIGEHEYEFYWYADDEVDASKIPVELPPDSKYLSYKWGERNIDGAYPAIITDTIPVKANISLYSDFTLNIYLPTDLGASAYATAEINGESTTVYSTVVDGVAYRVIQVKGIHPANAAGKINLTFDIEDGGMTASIKKEITVVEYLRQTLISVTAAEDKELIASMINYIDAAYKYVGKSDEALDALTASAEYQAITLAKKTDLEAKSTVSDLGIFEAVNLSLNNSLRMTFKVKDDFEGNIVFTYQKDGRKYVVTKKCDGGEELTLDLKAYELIQDIKISYGPDSGVYNIAAYLEYAKTQENVELVSLLDALWIYAEASAAYKAQNP